MARRNDRERDPISALAAAAPRSEGHKRMHSFGHKMQRAGRIFPNVVGLAPHLRKPARKSPIGV